MSTIGKTRAAGSAVYTFVNDTQSGRYYVDLPFKRQHALPKSITLRGVLGTGSKGSTFDKAEIRYLRGATWEVPSSQDVTVMRPVRGESNMYLVVRHTVNLPSAARAAHLDEFIAVLTAERDLLLDGVISSNDVITVPGGTVTP